MCRSLHLMNKTAMSEPKHPKSRAGRNVVYLAYAALAVYLSAAIFGSILVSLYGKPPDGDGAAIASTRQQRTWCVTALSGLRDELEHQLTVELTLPLQGGEPMRRFDAWAQAWRDSLTDTNERCTSDVDPALERTSEHLRQMYERYAQGLTNIVVGREELSRSFESEIEAARRRR